MIAVRAGFSNGSSLARAMAAEGMPSPSLIRAGVGRSRNDPGERVRRSAIDTSLELAA